ncbi:MAG: SH3 domain-containing protein, partial [Acidobacteriota bacterium]|nr:SH3 domain-containing protein [Acidobacteriota bacterium]
MSYRVNSLSLNFRSAPVVKPGNRIAVLNRGHAVTKLADVPDDPNWWQISVILHDQTLTGFVANRYLIASADFVEEPAAGGVREVHLKENRPDITRNRDGGRAYPLGEPGRPGRPSNSNDKPGDLGRIIDYLGVAGHARYIKHGSTTYCNIYAHDYCYLAGTFIPRVWWTRDAIAKLNAGLQVAPEYGETVRELTANSLTDWFEDYGAKFGWRWTQDLTECQEAANDGEVVIIVAQRKQLERSGHICAAVPETAAHRAQWTNSKVVRPLQSQAGAVNFEYRANTKWWTN